MADDFKALISVAYDLKQAQSELDKKIKQLQDSVKIDIKLSDKEAKKIIQDQISEQKKLANAIGKVNEKSQLKEVNAQRKAEVSQAKAINKALDEKYDKLLQEGKQLEKNRNLAKEYLQVAQKQLKDAVNKNSYGDITEANSLASKFNNGLTNFNSLDNVGAQIEKYKARVEGVISTLQKTHKANLSLLNKEIQNETNLQSKKDEFNKKNLNAIDLEIQKREEQARFYSNQIKSQMQEQVKVESQLQKSFSLDKSAENLDYRMTSFLNLNPKAVKAYSDQIAVLRERLISASKAADATEFKKVNTEFNTLTKQAQSLGLVGDTITSKLTKNVKQFLNFMGAATVTMTAINSAKALVSTIIDIDSAMINLRKVSSATEQQFSSFLSNAISMAKELGASIIDVINATGEFSRLGYNITDSTELARVATLYKNIGDGISAIDASKSIISTMKAFNYTADQASKIVDVFNEVGNRFAISSSGIGDSLQNSAAALMTANNTLEQSTALTVGANNVLQNPSEVGTLWKTVSMRIRGATSELEEAGLETEGIITSTSKLQAKIKELTGGFDIMLDEDTFKSTYDIIVGIGDEFSKLSDIKQAELLEILAGKRQGTGLASALTNVKDIKAAFDAASESSGSAMREQEALTKGIQYSIDVLKATLQETAMISMDSGIIKFFVELAIKAVNLVNALGGLPPILATVGTSLLVMKSGLLPAIAKEFIAITLAETGFQAASVKSAASNLGLSASFSTLAKSMKAVALAHPVLIGALGVGATILAVSSAIDALTDSMSELKERFEDANKAYEDTKIELTSINSELETTKTKIDELNSKDNLTFVESDELERLQSVNKELLLQQDILLKNQAIEAKNLADANKAKYDKEIGSKSVDYYANQDLDKRYSTSYDANNINQALGYKKIMEQALSTGEFDGVDIATNKVFNTEYIQEHIDDYVKIIKDGISKVNEYRQPLLELQNAGYLTDEQKQELTDLTNLLRNLYVESGQADDWGRIEFDSLYNSESFAKAKKDLEDLAQAGKLDESVIYRNTEFQKILSQTGLSASAVVKQIKALVAESNQLDSVDISIDTFEKLKTDIATVKDEVGKYGEKLQDLESYTQDLSDADFSFGYDQVAKITEKYPELEDAIYKTTEGWRIEQSAIDNLKTSVSGLEGSFATAEVNITNWLNSETGKRLEMYGLEITTLQELAELRAGKEMQYQQELGIGKQSLETMNPELYAELKMYQDSAKEIEAARKRLSELKTGGVGGSGSNSSSSSDKSGDTWKDSFDKELADLEYYRDKKEITEKQYLHRLNKLNEKYFKDNEKYLEDYRKYELEVINGMADLYTDSFENRKGVLDDKFGANLISEEQYYNRLKKLNDDYFQGKDEYYDTWLKTETEVQGKLLEIQQKAFTKSLDNQISEYEKEISKLEDKLDSLNDDLDGRNNAISAVSNYYDDEIEKINDVKEATEKYYDDQQSAIQSIIDQKKKVNEEINREKELQQSLYDLQRAQTQENKAYVVDGKVEYRVDNDAIRKAQDDVDNAKNEIEIDALENSIDGLEQLKKSAVANYDAQITKLKDLQESFNAVFENIEKLALEQYAVKFFGEDWKEEATKGKLLNMDSFVKKYQETQSAIKDTEAEIEAYQVKIDKIGEVKKAWEEADLTINQSIKNTAQALKESEIEELNAYNTKLAQLSTFVSQYNDLISNMKTATTEVKVDTKLGKTDKNGKLETRHSGVVAGAIGKPSYSSATDAFVALAKEPLKPNEVLIKALQGEHYILPNQINNLMSNFKNGLMSLNPMSQSQPVSVNIGDIVLQGVNDTNSLGNEIATRLGAVLSQKLNKR